MSLIAAVVALKKTGLWPFTARLGTATVHAVLPRESSPRRNRSPGLVVPGSGGCTR